jgi:hypothetical protein
MIEKPKTSKEWWSGLGTWRRIGSIVAVIGVGVLLWCAVHDQTLSEFAIKAIHELAWPMLLLVLLGYFYRDSLSKLLNRILRFKAAGVEFEAGPNAMPPDEAESLRNRLPQASPDEQRYIQTLLELSPAALRLLGALVAVGLSQNLNLERYKGRRYERGKQELRKLNLAALNARYYRPTLEGLGVFLVHVKALKEKMEAEQGQAE